MKRFVQVGFIAGLLARRRRVRRPTRRHRQGTPVADRGRHQRAIAAHRKLGANPAGRHRCAPRGIPQGSHRAVRARGKTLLPHFDTPYAAQLVLGQHWRTATPEQRKRFVEAFYKSLLYTYGDAMVDFTGDRLKVFPTKVAPTDERATVRTEIKRSNGTKVAVNYSLRKVNGAWKAWDVVIDGISYVKSYREDYGAEVQQKGLDAVIARLEAKAQSAKAAKVEIRPERMTQGGEPTNVRVGISESAAGRIVVTGELTFATARDARQLGVLVLESSRAERIVIDCSGVTRADSAGLAVLLDWLAWGRRKSRAVSLENLPASLVAIARDQRSRRTAHRSRLSHCSARAQRLRRHVHRQFARLCGADTCAHPCAPHNAMLISSSLPDDVAAPGSRLAHRAPPDHRETPCR